MDIAIIGWGLLTVGAGVVLAWRENWKGFLPVLIVGLCLVVVGGPTGQRLNSLKLTSKGLDVGLTAAEIQTGQVDAIKNKTIAAVTGTSTTSPTITPGTKSINPADDTLLGDVFAYLTSLGYVPTQIAGSESITPGSIVRFVDNVPIIWATPSQGFPSLNVSSVPSSFPIFTSTKPYYSVDDIQSTQLNANGATIATASYANLLASMSPEFAQKMIEDPTLFVVQETLSVSGLELMVTTQHKEQINRKFLFQSSHPVVMGYRLIQLKSGSK